MEWVGWLPKAQRAKGLSALDIAANQFRPILTWYKNNISKYSNVRLSFVDLVVYYFESSKWIGALTTTSDGDDVDNEGGYVTCPGAILFHLKVKCRPTNSLPAQL